MTPDSRSGSVTKTVLITGATGFLGSHICKMFVHKGYDVLAYCRQNSDFSRVSQICDQIRWYDVADGYDRPFSDRRRVDSVIHLATSYGRGKHELIEQVNTNVVFPLSLLELGRKHGISQFINTSSFIVKAAGSYDYLQSYALTKTQFSQWSKYYSVHFHVVDAVLEHVYGDNDNPDKFVPLVINTLLGDAEYMDLTDGEQQRDFIYAGDVAAAYEVIARASLSGQVGYREVGIGTGKACSIKNLVLELEDIVKSGTDLRFGILPLRKNEILCSKCDDSMLEHYDWRAITSLRDGLEKAIKFHKGGRSPNDVNSLFGNTDD